MLEKQWIQSTTGSNSELTMKWNRKDRSNALKFPVSTRDPIEVERSALQHYELEKTIVGLCLGNGLIPFTNRHIDVAVKCGSVSVIFEIKSCSVIDLQSPIRRAVLQLLEYRYLYRKVLSSDVRLCIVTERRPRGASDWLMGYLEHLNIGVIWKNDGNAELGCTHHTKELIGEVFPQLPECEFRPLLWK